MKKMMNHAHRYAKGEKRQRHFDEEEKKLFMERTHFEMANVLSKGRASPELTKAR